jgi:WD40 repeat protein
LGLRWDYSDNLAIERARATGLNGDLISKETKGLDMKKFVQALTMVIIILILQAAATNAQINCDVRAMAWHPNKNQFAFSCDTTIYIYTKQFQHIITLENPPEPPDTLARISSIAWSPNGDYLATSTWRFDALGGDGGASRVVIWDMQTAATVLDIPNRIGQFSWSTNSRFIAVASLFELDSLYFYDIETGQEIGECEACSNALALQWNPSDLNQFLVAHSSRILIFDPMTPKNTPLILDDRSAFSRGYSPDGTKIIIYNGEALQIEVRDTSTWQLISSLPFTTTGPLNNVIWLGNGIYIDNAIEGTLFWDGVSQQVLTLPINEIRFFFSPDGASYLSPETDGIFLYDSLTGNNIGGLLFETITMN